MFNPQIRPGWPRFFLVRTVGAGLVRLCAVPVARNKRSPHQLYSRHLLASRQRGQSLCAHAGSIGRCARARRALSDRRMRGPVSCPSDPRETRLVRERAKQALGRGHGRVEKGRRLPLVERARRHVVLHTHGGVHVARIRILVLEKHARVRRVVRAHAVHTHPHRVVDRTRPARRLHFLWRQYCANQVEAHGWRRANLDESAPQK